jgi:hypothetical protein
MHIAGKAIEPGDRDRGSAFDRPFDSTAAKLRPPIERVAALAGFNLDNSAKTSNPSSRANRTGVTRWLAAFRIKVKRALFNEIATSGYGARDGLLLRINQTNVSLARLCRGRSACPHRLQRQSGDQSLAAAALPGLRRPLRGLQSLQSHQLRTEQHRARRRSLNGVRDAIDRGLAGGPLTIPGWPSY